MGVCFVSSFSMMSRTNLGNKPESSILTMTLVSPASVCSTLMIVNPSLLPLLHLGCSGISTKLSNESDLILPLKWHSTKSKLNHEKVHLIFGLFLKKSKSKRYLYKSYFKKNDDYYFLLLYEVVMVEFISSRQVLLSLCRSFSWIF